MPYKIILKRKAIKSLQSISEPYYSSIKVAVYNLADDPRPPGCKKLKGGKGYRIRVASYRVIYHIFDDELVVHIINIGHRKDIYED